MELTKDQQKAYDLMMSGKNVFLTGEAGTGKSFLLNKFIEDNEDKKILITAPTGIAAIEIGGATLHRTFDIPVKDLHKISAGPKKVNDAVDAAEILIIDEISMCRLDVFEYVLKAIQIADRYRHPDDRYQIILVGDFLQLPPILSKDESSLYNELHGHSQVFPFFSPLWNVFNFSTIELKEVVRQQGDDVLIKNLNLARRGDSSCIPYFNNFVSSYDKFNDDAIFICPTNKKASEINNQKIDELDGDPVTYKSTVEGDVSYSDKPTDDELTLKVGARIMTLVNDSSFEYFNGSMGTCTMLCDGGIIAEMDNGSNVFIGFHEWEVRKYDMKEKKDPKTGTVKKEVKLKKIGSFTQLPIKVAFAITTHKSQGQTFDKAIIDPYAWDNGQLYVALSRVKTSEGLQLSKRISQNYLTANSSVLEFYKKYEEFLAKKDEDNKAAVQKDENIDREEIVTKDLVAMFFPKEYSEVLHEAVDSILANDKERFLEIADKIWEKK